MEINRVEGAAKNVVGKGEEFLGKVADKPGMQAQGLADQVVGAAQNLYGKTKSSINDAVDRLPDAMSDAADVYKDSSKQLAAQVGKQPIETLLLVGALGYLVGWAVNRAAR